MAAAVTGKEPDYRPAGPVLYPDIDRDPARRLVIDTLPNR
jgi:hypothetical protein